MAVLLYFDTTLSNFALYRFALGALESEVLFWDLVFLHGAGGPGNPCFRVQAYLVNFALHFQKC